jgi:hypothetical protein
MLGQQTVLQSSRSEVALPRQASLRAFARSGRFVEPDQRDLGGPVLFAKIFPFTADPNQLYIPSVLSHRGAFRDRHGRRERDAVDAAALGAQT